MSPSSLSGSAFRAVAAVSLAMAVAGGLAGCSLFPSEAGRADPVEPGEQPTATAEPAPDAVDPASVVFIGDELEWLLLDEARLTTASGSAAQLGEVSNDLDAEPWPLIGVDSCPQYPYDDFSGDQYALMKIDDPAGFRGVKGAYNGLDYWQAVYQQATIEDAAALWHVLGFVPVECIDWLSDPAAQDDAVFPAVLGTERSGQGKAYAQWAAIRVGNAISVVTVRYDGAVDDESAYDPTVWSSLLDELRAQATDASERLVADE